MLKHIFEPIRVSQVVIRTTVQAVRSVGSSHKVQFQSKQDHERRKAQPAAEELHLGVDDDPDGGAVLLHLPWKKEMVG